MYHTDHSSAGPSLEPFFGQSLDGLCISDYHGNFVKVNPTFQKLLGYSLKELYSTKIVEFMCPDDRDHTLEQRKKLVVDGALVNFENRYIRKSGELVWLNWTSFSLPEKKLIYSSARDITHRKKMEQDRISTIKRLSLSNEKLKQQNYSTSHDLRSPLNNLMSLVDLIDLETISKADTKEILELIKLSAMGLKHTFDSYLDSFKISELSGKRMELVHFDAILQKVQSSISNLITNSKTKFHVDFSGLEVVKFKSNYMESIFLNLITNSIKYAKPGTKPLISIRSQKKDGSKMLIYEDNGLGFDMEEVGHRIFKLNERFHKNKDSKGVGLYLVHNQLTDLGGSIAVESKVNEGTTFTITFK